MPNLDTFYPHKDPKLSLILQKLVLDLFVFVLGLKMGSVILICYLIASADLISSAVPDVYTSILSMDPYNISSNSFGGDQFLNVSSGSLEMGSFNISSSNFEIDLINVSSGIYQLDSNNVSSNDLPLDPYNMSSINLGLDQTNISPFLQNISSLGRQINETETMPESLTSPETTKKTTKSYKVWELLNFVLNTTDYGSDICILVGIDLKPSDLTGLSVPVQIILVETEENIDLKFIMTNAWCVR